MSEDLKHFHMLSWNTEDATIKGYATSSRGQGGTVLKIELEVRDPYRLSRLVETLEEAKSAQKEYERARKEKEREIKEAARRPRRAALPAPKDNTLPYQSPLQITFRGDK